jgi:hypothetical protein
MTEKLVIDGFVIPDELSSLVFKLYGQKNYNQFCDPKKHIWDGKLMLWDIEYMDSDDYNDFKATFNAVPAVNKETAHWLIDRGYDCFGWIKKGWVASCNIFYDKGYHEALKHMDRNLLKYQRELRAEEDKMGIREENKGTLFERRSWAVFENSLTESEPVEFITTFKTDYGYCEYEHNEIGKIVRRTEISHDGEVLYEGKFTYRFFRNNYFLAKYENTNGIEVHYDRISHERRGFQTTIN